MIRVNASVLHGAYMHRDAQHKSAQFHARERGGPPAPGAHLGVHLVVELRDVDDGAKWVDPLTVRLPYTPDCRPIGSAKNVSPHNKSCCKMLHGAMCKQSYQCSSTIFGDQHSPVHSSTATPTV
jgi:hypothetical protein